MIPNNTSLNAQDIDRLRMVINTTDKFQNIPSMSLFQILNDKYKNSGTFSVIAFTLKKFFAEIENPRKAAFWGNVGQHLSDFVKQQESKNELSNREKENWRSQDEIKDIIDKIEIKDRTDYNRFLLLSMATMQPPLRKSFYQSLKFATSIKQLNHVDNFVFLSPDKCYYVINRDKVSKFDRFNKPDNKYIEIESERLCELLRDSYNQDERDYVFETSAGQPYSINSISILLLERPFKLNFNILRSSYITQHHEDHKTMYDKENLARQMRHGVHRAMVNYNKPNRPLMHK